MKRGIGYACLGLLLGALLYEFGPDGSSDAGISSGIPEPVRSTMARLRSRRPFRRCEAALELGRLQSGAAVPFLIPLLSDTEDAMPLLERPLQGSMMGSRSRAVRECAVTALGQMGAAATPVLIQAAGGSDAEIRRHAVSVLSFSADPPATQFMEGLLEDPDPLLRIAALTSVVQHGRPGKSEAIRRALQDSESRVRTQALVFASAESEGWVYDVLIHASRDADVEVRSVAVDRLGARGDGRAVDILIDRLSDPDLAVRQRAHNSLRLLTREDFGGDPAAWRAGRGTGR